MAGLREARAALRRLREIRARKEMNFRRIVKTFFPKGELGEVAIRTILTSGTLNKNQKRAIEAFANAGRILGRQNCIRCNIHESIARWICDAQADGSIRTIEAIYRGEYWVFTPLVLSTFPVTDDEREYSVMYHNARIDQCQDCGRFVFCVWKRRDGIPRMGGIYRLDLRIHLLLLENKYFQHVVLSPVNVGKHGSIELRGLALFEPDEEEATSEATRIVFVKRNNGLKLDKNLYARVKNELARAPVNSSGRPMVFPDALVL